MSISELFSISDRWSKAGLIHKVLYFFVSLFVIFYGVLMVVSKFEPAIEFNNKYNITSNIVNVINMPVMTTGFAALIILSTIITIVIAAFVIVSIIIIGEKRVLNTKVNAKDKIKAHQEVIYNISKALDMLSRFPYQDGTAVGRNKDQIMEVTFVKKGVPNPQTLEQISDRVRDKDTNISELIDRAKKSIEDNNLYHD
ncbi:MAG: hypothetical protein WA137_01945 [Methanothrix sp.]